MKKACQIEWKTSNSVVLRGEIDEHCDFSSFSQASGQVLYVDLAGITRLNSSGLRSWIQTITKHTIQLVLRECSPTVVEQYSLVPEFIGAEGKVESFYARYPCDSCDEEALKRFQVDKDLSAVNPQIPLLLDQPCPVCGDEMHLDQSPEIYLSFLKNSHKPGNRAS